MKCTISDKVSRSKNTYRICDLAAEDKPREKLIKNGSGTLTTAELLGILLGVGTKDMNSINLAQLILSDCENDLESLAKYSVKDLQKFNGIGESKAAAIVSAMELTRRRNSQAKLQKPRFGDSVSVYDFMKPELVDKTKEEFWIVLLNKSNYLIKKIFISSGGINNTLADPKLVFKHAFEYNATNILLVHNHPSENPNPSQNDIDLTKKMIEGAKILDMHVLDHIIIAGNCYFSFVDEKLLFN